MPAGQVTRLLQAWNKGDATARDELMPVIYAELRRRAAARLRHERAGHSLHPTDLVHETYLRLCAQNIAWQNREQFFAVASHLMRRILVDHARARAAAKRGGGLRVTMAEIGGDSIAADPEMLDLDRALGELTALDEAQARLVELRFFGGLSVEEAARIMGVSRTTANRDWQMAKSWLYRRLKQTGGGRRSEG
ncbi:MAG: RNA polymerase subunit sigma-70 [Acidobacteria bacterium]|nr:MAG: RNA polymerase subunit sigma-70 [Acidobacteriota bacterium]